MPLPPFPTVRVSQNIDDFLRTDDDPEARDSIQAAKDSEMRKVYGGCVRLIRPGMDSMFFVAEADSNDGRVAALADAIAHTIPGSTILLLSGTYILGVTLASMGTHTSWKLGFTVGTWLAYTTGQETLAENSDWAYETTQRYAWQHGIIATQVSEPLALDAATMRSRIMAALFSMRASYDPCEKPPNNEYPNFTTRCGTLFMEQGGHCIHKPIYVTGLQQIIGIGGRPTQLLPTGPTGLTSGFAPTVEIFCIHFLRAVINLGSGPIAASNFSFEFRIENIALENQYFDAGNAKVSGLLFGGAQGSRIDGLWVRGMGHRSVFVHGNSNYFHIGRLFCDAGPNQTGPHLEIQYCGNFELGEMELQMLNANPYAVKRYSTPIYGGGTQEVDLMGLAMFYCTNFTITKINGEQMRSMARIVNCENFKIGPVANELNNFYQPPGSPPPALVPMGGDMVSMRGCRFCSVGPFAGQGFDRLYAITDNQDNYVDDVWIGGATLGRADGIDYTVRALAGLETHSLSFPRNYPDPTHTDVSTWRMVTGGGVSGYTFYLSSYGPTGSGYTHLMAIKPYETAGQMPGGFTMGLDVDAQGGVSVSRFLNVGWSGGLPAADPAICVNGQRVIGQRELGWTALAGTGIKGGLDTATMTPLQTNQVLKALIDALIKHGLIRNTLGTFGDFTASAAPLPAPLPPSVIEPLPALEEGASEVES